MSLKNVIPIAPTADQITLMNSVWSQDKVVSTTSTGQVGMFGSADPSGGVNRYFLYMTFIPATNIATTSSAGWFRLWCQIGNTASDWHGVYF